MLIAHIADYYDTFGGMKTHVDSLIEALLYEDIDSVVLVPQSTHKTGWDLAKPSILWVYVDKSCAKNFNDYSMINAVSSCLQDKGIDIIHAHTASGYYIGAYLALYMSLPLVFTMHGGWLYHAMPDCMGCDDLSFPNICNRCRVNPDNNSYISRANYIFLQHRMYLAVANKVIVLNKRSYDHCADFFKVPKDKLVYSHLWVDILPETEIQIKRKAMHQKMQHKGLTANKTILWVGTDRKFKRLDIALKAFEALLQEYECYLFIAGVSQEQVNARIDTSKTNVLKHVQAFGRLSSEELSYLYAGADVLWQPSVCESVSYVLLEAMANHLPCIAIRGLGNQDFLSDEENVLLVDKDDVDAFVEKTKYLFRNEAFKNKIVTTAKKTLLKTNTKDKCVAVIMEAYKEVTKK